MPFKGGLIMGRYSVDSEKLLNNEYWSNRYIVEADNLTEAITIASVIRAIEQDCCTTEVTLTKYRVSTTAVGDDTYQIMSDNITGTKSIDSGRLPLFCRVRIDFNTVGGGRPSRKYWLPPLQESEVVNEMLETAARTFYNDNYLQPMLAVDGFVDVDGQLFNGGSVIPKVAMRQLRRGSKRKVLPIIP